MSLDCATVAKIIRTSVMTSVAVVNLLLLDQFAKAAAVYFLKPVGSRAVVPGFFNLTYVENCGAAWGVFQGQSLPLAGFAIGALVLIAWKRRAIFVDNFGGRLTEVLLYAGIIGNLVDRLTLGHVVDFLDFHWYSHHFPVFNFADSFITIAAALLILEAVLGSVRRRKAT